jgi:tRNA pseudouridine38-40 synthase
VQPGQVTVQSTLEAALESALGHTVQAIAAGRTDAGVHADGQVVSFETSSTIPADGLIRTLPRWLPGDIWPMEAADVDAAFDARRSVVRRWYRYAVWRGPTPTSTWQGRALAVGEAFDLASMRRAAHSLLGERDFASLATEVPSKRSTIRTVFAADWLTRGPLAVFEICADAFLKHMVRGIVGSLLWVGSGHWTPDDFRTALDARDRRAGGPNAPAVGLTLARIEY